MPVVRWTFTDVFQRGDAPYLWTFPVNPKEGGSLSLSRSVEAAPTVGNRRAVAMEGSRQDSVLSFSGSILTREHLEAMEAWHTKRILIELRDDLGRTYRGTFSTFTPSRVRKASNFWYHSYEAGFYVLSYRSASGTMLLGEPFTPIDGRDVGTEDWDGEFPSSIMTGVVDGGGV